MSAFCEKCQSLDVDETLLPLRETLEGSWEGDQPGDEIPLSTTWYKGLKDVILSATSCVLCALVVKGWRESRIDAVERNLESGDIIPDSLPDLYNDIVEIEAYADQDKADVSLKIVVKKKASFGKSSGCSVLLQFVCCPRTRGSWQACDPVRADFRIAREDKRPPRALYTVTNTYDGVLDELMCADPLSTESLHLAKSWMLACTETHGGVCNGAQQLEGSRVVPSRLLEINREEGYLRLRLMKDILQDASHQPARRPAFVALSHCWGDGGTPFTTTKETLEERKRRIDMYAMPHTFQDAVVVLSALGLRYLWIDSLCILQDDLQDWYLESKEMATIYRDACLVLGAASGVSDAAGFLHDREMRDVARLPQIQGNKTNALLSLVLLPRERRRWTDRDGPDPLESEPLNARSWCLQERCLPRRSLQYATDGMIWECGHIRASEHGDVVTQNGGHLERICQTANIPSSVFQRPSGAPYEEKELVNGVGWYNMVQDFAARGITKHTDRLPALSGLAAAVSEARGDEYLAGLWKSSLIEGLMWCTARRGQALGLADEYIAPSWSWTSILGPVHFSMYDWYSRALWKAKMSDFEPLAQYLSHQAGLAGPDPNGRLNSGILHLQAPLLKVKSVQPRPDKPPAGPQLWGQAPLPSPFTDQLFSLQEDDTNTSKELWIEGAFDQHRDANAQRDLFILFLARLPHVLEDGFLEHRFGLVLAGAPAAASAAYRRVGFVDGVILEKPGDGTQYRFADYTGQRRSGDMDDTERPNDLAPYPSKLEGVEVALV